MKPVTLKIPVMKSNEDTNHANLRSSVISLESSWYIFQIEKNAHTVGFEKYNISPSVGSDKLDGGKRKDTPVRKLQF
jgi:hypothetical protein